MNGSIGNLKTIFISLSSIFLLTCPAKAQLIPDNTLGREGSLVVPDANNQSRDNIEGGATRGSNLFHSFREFNINTGREVYFTNPTGVDNILTRVTGGNISNIFGTLGVNGNANLYLINPNGIVFGNGATLDINGSFIGTTADGVRLGANDVYSATDPASSNLLTIQPGALFVNRVNNAIQRQITVDGADLSVSPGQNITLSADAIDIIGFSSLIAPGGSIEIGAINGGINLGIFNPVGFTDNKGFLDTISATGNGGNISLNATGGDININGTIDVSSEDIAGNSVANGGNINIVTDRNINLDFDSGIFSFGILGGNINLSSSGDTNLFSEAAIQSVSTGNVPIPGVRGGTISIAGNSVNLFQGASITTNTFDAIDGGIIDIQGRSSVLVSGIPRFAGARSRGITADNFGSGNGGSISIDTPLLEVDNLATISVNNEASGNGGSIDINSGSLRVLNGALISANSSDTASGNGGSIDINSGSIEIIGVDTFNEKISSITADNLGFGDRGSIDINTGSLRVLNGGLISSNTFGDNLFGTGIEGNITINAQSLEIDGFQGGNVSSITADNFSNQIGRTGGSININTNSLQIRNFGEIVADAVGSGDGGNININALESIKISDRVDFNFTDLFTAIISTSTESTGQAGNISIATNLLSIKNGGLIRSETIADGNAGLIDVRANSIEIIGSNPANFSIDSGLVTLSNGRGNPGDIKIDTNRLQVLNGAEINADNIFRGSGRPGTTGGHINIRANLIEIIGADFDNNSRISSGTLGFFCDAGTLDINTDRLRLLDGGFISTSVPDFRTVGNGGDINIQANSVEVIGINISQNNCDLCGSPSAITTQSLGQGNAGNLSIKTNSLNVLDGGQILSDTTFTGNSGNINIESQSIKIVGIDRLTSKFPSGIFATTNGTGNGANIKINTDNLQLKDGGIITASSVSNTNNLGNEGDAGNIGITASSIELIGSDTNGFISSFSTETGGVGNAGSININTANLRVLNGAEISARTTGTGNAGAININHNTVKANTVEIANSASLLTRTTGTGNAGDVTINSNNLRLLNGGAIRTDTVGNGRAGNINLERDRADNIEIIGVNSGLFTETSGAFSAGSININTANLRVLNGAEISARTTGTGNAGAININHNTVKANTVEIANSASLLTRTTGTGNAGDVTINSNNLRLLNGGAIRTDTVGNGRAGNINIHSNLLEAIATDTLGNSSGLFTETTGAKNAGNININTERLNILNGAQISASTAGTGRGGDININNNTTPANSLEIIGANSGIFTETTRAGNAGSAIINTRNLLIKERATISANSSVNATGDSGSIFITNADNISIENLGTIRVSNFGTGVGGNIDIDGNILRLDRGNIVAESNASQGGNINLSLRDFLSLRNQSIISATAGINQGAGNGGNITIETPFIYSFPSNNLIIANAFSGAGGNIDITTNVIFGYPQLLDITASSNLGIDGTISINGLSDEITRGQLLTVSPPIDAEAILANDICEFKDDKIARGSSFTIIGKGGITPNPLETVDRTPQGIIEWSNKPNRETRINKRQNNSDRQTQSKPFNPAVGWYRKPDGTVVLTANPAEVRPLDKPIDYHTECQNYRSDLNKFN